MAQFLRYLTDHDRARLAEWSERRRFPTDEVVLAEGDRRHAIFVVCNGEARVERAHEEYFVEISRLGPGEIFGEMSFIEDSGASASVVADEGFEVEIIDGERVHDLLEDDPAFAARFYRSLADILSRRLRAANEIGIAEYAWGGRVLEESPAEDERPEGAWAGGSPLSDAMVDEEGRDRE